MGRFVPWFKELERFSGVLPVDCGYFVCASACLCMGHKQHTSITT